tara:strand:- start:413 stop:1411 length:999 start_codon:yes stop_codon:yes gene_type:complete
MRKKYLSRRKLLNYISLFILFLLASCRNISKEVKIALQSSLYPDFFKDVIPNFWQKENINLGSINSEKNRSVIRKSDFILITDGWVNNINFDEFEKINENSLFENLDIRTRNFLNSYEEKQREKLFPIGIVPYAVIIKNNKYLINSASKSWDFLLSEKLTRKIIFPRSPRVVLSIARKITGLNSIARIKKQAMLFDDQNSLNWLINSDACVAIIPYSFCLEYLKIDSRLSIVFPDQGVPLTWHFILSRSNNNNEILLSWIKSLENKLNVDKLAIQGWYLPFENKFSQINYNRNNSWPLGPSQSCWENSWSFPPLTKIEKINLENSWKESLTP